LREGLRVAGTRSSASSFSCYWDHLYAHSARHFWVIEGEASEDSELGYEVVRNRGPLLETEDSLCDVFCNEAKDPANFSDIGSVVERLGTQEFLKALLQDDRSGLGRLST
jgi:hypothetical protein